MYDLVGCLLALQLDVLLLAVLRSSLLLDSTSLLVWDLVVLLNVVPPPSLLLIFLRSAPLLLKAPVPSLLSDPPNFLHSLPFPLLLLSPPPDAGII